MKKIFSYAILLLCGTLAFTACSDDNDSNPTIVQPQEFSMFQPSVGTATIDLSSSSSIELSWTLPVFTDFGAPVVPTFVVQVSPTGSFTQQFDRTQKDNTGADFIEIDQTFNTAIGKVNAEALNLALQELLGWTSEDAVPATVPVTARAKACVRDASFNEYSTIISSNAVNLNVAPYFVNLKPTLWYLVGNNIGSSAWANSADGAGKGLIPLLPSSKEEGVISHTGFFSSGTQFKFILNPGSWDDQLNYENVDTPDGSLISDEDGDNHNIGIKADGYYTISVNTSTKKITIEAYTGTVKTFTSMGMPGSYNGWNEKDDNMTACETLLGESHIWTAKFEPTEDGELKFAADGAWNDNWGSADFPYGTGTNGGDNIQFVAGSYTVFFNDITGQYYFIANETE